MTSKMWNLTLNSLNCRGLRSKTKREVVFDWLKKYNRSITLLQETHSDPSVEKQWEKEYGGTIIFCHGTSNSKGVAILIPKMLNVTLLDQDKDDGGRILVIHIECENENLIITNVCAPTKDDNLGQEQYLP